MNFRFNKHRNLFVPLLAVALVLVAADCEAATIWDRFNAFTSGLSSVKPLILIVGLVGGLACFLGGGYEIVKLKNERGDAKWSNVGYYSVGAAIMTGLSVWAGLFQETITGQTSGNLSMVVLSYLV